MTAENLRIIHDLLADVDHSSPSVSKYRALEEFLAELTGLPATRIYTGYVSKAGNLSVRMVQSARAQEASLLVALIQRSNEDAATLDTARKVAIRTAKPLLLMQYKEGRDPAWVPMASYVVEQDSAGKATLTALVRALASFDISTVTATALPAKPMQLGLDQTLDEVSKPATGTVTVPTLKLDPRTRRMLRNAISSHKAVMLVGPPGTGKSSLVHEIVREVRDDPSKFGMSMDHEIMVVTADESWTTRELVGGDSVDDSGRLRFTPGLVLQAIEEDKWLLLDEANRADMDRIFGGLLTWLTGSDGAPVNVGRTSPGSSSDVITLGWATGARSECERVSPDTRDGEDEEEFIVRYSAGQEWRLIGTYNSIDAQRVFRFGLALGRRFAQVPVPPPSVALFRELIDEQIPSYDLDPAVANRIAGIIVHLYEIHIADSSTAMGPALFLTLPDSVAAGLPEARDELIPLMAESYLTNFGPWLSRQDDDVLDSLGTVMAQSDVFGVEWSWVREQLQHLGR